MYATKAVKIIAAAVAIGLSAPALAEHERAERNNTYRDRHGPVYEAPRSAPAPVYRRQGIQPPAPVHRTIVERSAVRNVVVSRPVYVERPVVVRRPAVREVVVERPVIWERPRVVYQDARAYSDPYPPYRVAHHDGHSMLATIGGAMIGALIGSQVVEPEHRSAATVAGAVIGGVIGNNF